MPKGHTRSGDRCRLGPRTWSRLSRFHALLTRQLLARSLKHRCRRISSDSSSGNLSTISVAIIAVSTGRCLRGNPPLSLMCCVLCNQSYEPVICSQHLSANRVRKAPVILNF